MCLFGINLHLFHTHKLFLLETERDKERENTVGLRAIGEKQRIPVGSMLSM